MSDTISISYVPLAEVQRWPRNPKKHDFKQLMDSLRRFGFTLPVIRDDESGRLVAGHGRLEALQKMRDAGEPPPKRVAVNGSGEWCLPVVTGVSFSDEREAEAYLIADNRLTEIGGWDDSMLASMLENLQLGATGGEEPFEGVGFSSQEINALFSDVRADRQIGKTPQEKVEGLLTSEIRQLVFYFDLDDYASVIERIEKLCADHNLETHSDALLFLLSQHQ